MQYIIRVGVCLFYQLMLIFLVGQYWSSVLKLGQFQSPYVACVFGRNYKLINLSIWCSCQWTDPTQGYGKTHQARISSKWQNNQHNDCWHLNQLSKHHAKAEQLFDLNICQWLLQMITIKVGSLSVVSRDVLTILGAIPSSHFCQSKNGW